MPSHDTIYDLAHASGIHLHAGQTDAIIEYLDDQEHVACYVPADALFKVGGDGLRLKEPGILITEKRLVTVQRLGLISNKYKFKYFSFANLSSALSIARPTAAYGPWHVDWQMTSGAWYRATFSTESSARTLHDCLGRNAAGARIDPESVRPIQAPYWSSVERIKGEWPRDTLNVMLDLQNFQRALALYERDDYESMMQCATLFAAALAHSLYGSDLVHGTDLRDAVHKTLFCALCAPPDGRTFAESAERAARLALTIMRENAWQPASFGGITPLSEPMIMDKGNCFLLSAAVAPPGEPWAGDLRAFFSVPSPSRVGGSA